MSAWVCWACRAHGESDVDVCPKCGPGTARLTVWLCCECRMEGTGQRPDVCPACGCHDSWYQATTDPDDPRPAKALFDEMMDGIFSPSRRKH